MTPLAIRALSIAQGQVDQDEKPHGSNWGRPVQNYLASVGIYIPASWCMAFIYWCFRDAAGQLGLPNSLNKTGGCLAQWHNSQAFKKPDPSPVQAGDVFIMDHGHGLGHTGIVESVNPDGSMNTIEGNTNDTGSREGYEVARKLRHSGIPIIGYLRF